MSILEGELDFYRLRRHKGNSINNFNEKVSPAPVLPCFLC